MTDLILEFANVTAGYGADPVFADLSFELRAGEGICLLGANGSGKSTVLRAAARMCDVISGSVRFLDADVRRIPRRDLARRGLTYVTQSRSLFPSLTVEENIRIAALGAGQHQTVDINSVLAAFSLSRTISGRPAGQLSGGERTIVALARALVLRPGPRLLLLDEASTGLSRINEAVLRETLSGLRAQGAALMVSEQNTGFADSLGIPIRQLRRSFARGAEEVAA